MFDHEQCVAAVVLMGQMSASSGLVTLNALAGEYTCWPSALSFAVTEELRWTCFQIDMSTHARRSSSHYLNPQLFQGALIFAAVFVAVCILHAAATKAFELNAKHAVCASL